MHPSPFFSLIGSWFGEFPPGMNAFLGGVIALTFNFLLKRGADFFKLALERDSERRQMRIIEKYMALPVPDRAFVVSQLKPKDAERLLSLIEKKDDTSQSSSKREPASFLPGVNLNLVKKILGEATVKGVTKRGKHVVYHFPSGDITLTRDEEEKLKKQAEEIARKTFPALAS